MSAGRILRRPVFSLFAMVTVFSLAAFSLVTGSCAAAMAAVLAVIVQAIVVFGVWK
jgi:hypothetical protein